MAHNSLRFNSHWNGIKGISRISLVVFWFGIVTSYSSNGSPTSVDLLEDGEVGGGTTDVSTGVEVPNIPISSLKLASGGYCECGTVSSDIFDEPTPGFEKTVIIRNAREISEIKNIPHITPLIVDGVNAVRGTIPWMVAITKYQHNRLPRWRVICGGAVLSDRYVLTAAHCLTGKYKDTLEAVFNVGNVSRITEDSNVIRRKIKRLIIHSEYSKTSQVDNDIALIELAVPLDLTSKVVSQYVRPVCIPTTSEEDFYANKMGVVSGWGKTQAIPAGVPNKGDNSDHLLQVSVPILSRDACLKTDLPRRNNVTENMICAGFLDEGGRDACVNDSGGPLTVDHYGRSYVVGVVSWGWGCAQKGYPGVYTNIGRYTSWIQENSQGQGCGRNA